MKALTLSDFIYNLPEDLIAQQPLPHRDDSRLLVYHQGQPFQDTYVKNLPSLIPEGSLVIANNSRVIPSRLIGQLPTGGKAEIFLLEQLPAANSTVWKAIGRPQKKFYDDLQITFKGGCTGTLSQVQHSEGQVAPFLVTFDQSPHDFFNWIAEFGYIPLPPYILRQDPQPASSSHDTSTYQTVYAQPVGSVAAPTAGLHFTQELLQELKDKNVSFHTVTLHVGAGTFLPVKTEDLNEHIMHEERFTVPSATISAILKARQEGRKIIAVGTTTFRALQSLFEKAGAESNLMEWSDRQIRTQLFVRPKTPTDRFQAWGVDALMTNFHQPGSTLFMLICALLGWEEAKFLYAHAVNERYRFLSYGDSSLLWLAPATR